MGYNGGAGGTGELDRCMLSVGSSYGWNWLVSGQQNIFIGDNPGGGSWTTFLSNSNVYKCWICLLNGGLHNGKYCVGHDGLKTLQLVITIQL